MYNFMSNVFEFACELAWHQSTFGIQFSNYFGLAGGGQVVADAAPNDATGEGGGGEIYGVKKWDERGEESPGPGVGLEFLFVRGEKIENGEPAEGSFDAGKQHDQYY